MGKYYKFVFITKVNFSSEVSFYLGVRNLISVNLGISRGLCLSNKGLTQWQSMKVRQRSNAHCHLSIITTDMGSILSLQAVLHYGMSRPSFLLTCPFMSTGFLCWPYFHS